MCAFSPSAPAVRRRYERASGGIQTFPRGLHVHRGGDAVSSPATVNTVYNHVVSDLQPVSRGRPLTPRTRLRSPKRRGGVAPSVSRSAGWTTRKTTARPRSVPLKSTLGAWSSPSSSFWPLNNWNKRHLRDLGVLAAVGDALSEARERYPRGLPGIQDMRNALMHFDDWAMGRGRGPQKAGVITGSEPRDVAGHFWGFGYHQDQRVVRLGPFRIGLAMAAPAELDVAETIDAGAHEVDRQPPESQPAQMGNAPQVARGTATVPLDLRPRRKGLRPDPCASRHERTFRQTGLTRRRTSMTPCRVARPAYEPPQASLQGHSRRLKLRESRSKRSHADGR